LKEYLKILLNNLKIDLTLRGNFLLAKMIILYEQPKDKEGFEKHYFNIHVPLGKRIPYIKNESVRRVIQLQNTNLNLYLITELEFESMDTLNQAMSSAET
jgi:uncharacterized protein (TIGR02118 family)